MCFDAYFKQTLHDSSEQYLLRKAKIYYYPEDASISVLEPRIENSGIPQGVLIKRHRIPKEKKGLESSSFFGEDDLHIGGLITFYGKTFKITGCDVFTRVYNFNTIY